MTLSQGLSCYSSLDLVHIMLELLGARKLQFKNCSEICVKVTADGIGGPSYSLSKK